MNQSDIFRLLLIILLLGNNGDENCSGLGNINQIIIILLLLNPPFLAGLNGNFDDDTTTF